MTKMEDGEVVISGYLRKSPPEAKFKVSTWQKRYFVLRANKQLHYYKNDKEKRPVKGPINLTNCKSVESHLDHYKFKYVFSVVTEQRTYYLVADSQREMETWVDKLCRVCGFSRTDDDNNSPDLNAAPKSNVYHSSPAAHSRPVSAARLRTLSPAGSPSSVSSSGSSVTSPTGPCPLSIPKHVIDDRNKVRSMSDPPEHFDAPQVHREKNRRQSEQVGIPTCPINFQGVPNGAFSPTGATPRRDLAALSLGFPSESYNVLPSPRSLSRDSYDNLPSPHRIPRGQETQENYHDVPFPRPINRLASPSSPRGRQLSSAHEDYDAVPAPRPVSQASNRSSQEVYDMVPPPRPTSSGSDTQEGLYDVPPLGKTQENENYDVVPLPRPTSCDDQDLYDVPPIGKAHEQDNYDIVPLPRRTSYGDTHGGQDIYDVPPLGRAQEQENYDIVPQPRSVSSYSDTQDGQGRYDVLPVGKALASEQANYDILPPLHRPRQIQPDPSKENYDVVPIPRRASQEVYDVVPPARATPSGSMPRDGGDPRFSDVHNTLSNERTSADVYDWVPPPIPSPYQPSQDVYDTVPNNARPVSADSGLNASYSSICSLKSEGSVSGQDDKYDAPLPPVPNGRDSGSLSDETPDYDHDPEEIYDKPPNLASRNSIYDVPPKLETLYDVLPTHPSEIYDVAPTTSDDIYDVPPQIPSQGVPAVDRSTKRPPEINRAIKPKAVTQDHSYCNMAPPVNRENKHKRSTMPQPEHSYMNCGTPPLRPQHLPLVKILTGNSYVGSLPNQANKWCAVRAPVDDLEYCEMAPTRSQWTRCYSLDKDDRPTSPATDQCYEDMSAMHAKMSSGAKSSSSSSSSLADNDDAYTQMVPGHVSSPIQMEQRRRRDLLYAEVEIVESPGHVKTPLPLGPPRKENTHYTYINEESTRALLQTSNARRENR